MMQKKPLFNPRQTLLLAYLLAVVLWLVRCPPGSAPATAQIGRAHV